MRKQRRGAAAEKRAGGPSPILKGSKGNLTLPGGYGEISYHPDFLDKSDADALYEAMLNAPGWEQTPITFFGKTVLQPRETAFYGSELYSYSDEKREPIPWDFDSTSRAVHELGHKIEAYMGLPTNFFNVTLCNKYVNGKQYMGYHSDDEASMGDAPTIASVSVGAERRFLCRPKPEALLADNARIEYVLAHGSLLVMSGRMQTYYKHSLPKAAAVSSPRLNFTFRRVVGQD